MAITFKNRVALDGKKFGINGKIFVTFEQYNRDEWNVESGVVISIPLENKRRAMVYINLKRPRYVDHVIDFEDFKQEYHNYCLNGFTRATNANRHILLTNRDFFNFVYNHMMNTYREFGITEISCKKDGM